MNAIELKVINEVIHKLKMINTHKVLDDVNVRLDMARNAEDNMMETIKWNVKMSMKDNVDAAIAEANNWLIALSENKSNG